MIFIIRGLSQVRKRMMATMIPPQVGMRLRTLWKIKEAKEAQIKKIGQRAQTKKWEKKTEGTMLLSFTTLVFQSSTMIFMIESLLCCHYHILVENFHYRTWLVYSNDGLPQKCPRSSWASKLDAPHLVSFIELSYIYSSSASVAWKSLLTHIDIY